MNDLSSVVINKISSYIGEIGVMRLGGIGNKKLSSLLENIPLMCQWKLSAFTRTRGITNGRLEPESATKNSRYCWISPCGEYKSPYVQCPYTMESLGVKCSRFIWDNICKVSVQIRFVSVDVSGWSEEQLKVPPGVTRLDLIGCKSPHLVGLPSTLVELRILSPKEKIRSDISYLKIKKFHIDSENSIVLPATLSEVHDPHACITADDFPYLKKASVFEFDGYSGTLEELQTKRFFCAPNSTCTITPHKFQGDKFKYVGGALYTSSFEVMKSFSQHYVKKVVFKTSIKARDIELIHLSIKKLLPEASEFLYYTYDDYDGDLGAGVVVMKK